MNTVGRWVSVILVAHVKMDYFAFLEHMGSDPEACHDADANHQIVLEDQNLVLTDGLAFRKEVVRNSIWPNYAPLVVHRALQKLALPVVEHVEE